VKQGVVAGITNKALDEIMQKEGALGHTLMVLMGEFVMAVCQETAKSMLSEAKKKPRQVIGTGARGASSFASSGGGALSGVASVAKVETFYLQKLKQQEKLIAEKDEEDEENKKKQKKSEHNANHYRVLHQGALRKIEKREAEISDLKKDLLKMPKIKKALEAQKEETANWTGLVTKFFAHATSVHSSAKAMSEAEEVLAQTTGQEAGIGEDGDAEESAEEKAQIIADATAAQGAARAQLLIDLEELMFAMDQAGKLAEIVSKQGARSQEDTRSLRGLFGSVARGSEAAQARRSPMNSSRGQSRGSPHHLDGGAGDGRPGGRMEGKRSSVFRDRRDAGFIPLADPSFNPNQERSASRGGDGGDGGGDGGGGDEEMSREETEARMRGGHQRRGSVRGGAASQAARRAERDKEIERNRPSALALMEARVAMGEIASTGMQTPLTADVLTALRHAARLEAQGLSTDAVAALRQTQGPSRASQTGEELIEALLRGPRSSGHRRGDRSRGGARSPPGREGYQNAAAYLTSMQERAGARAALSLGGGNMFAGDGLQRWEAPAALKGIGGQGVVPAIAAGAAAGTLGAEQEAEAARLRKKLEAEARAPATATAGAAAPAPAAALGADVPVSLASLRSQLDPRPGTRDVAHLGAVRLAHLPLTSGCAPTYVGRIKPPHAAASHRCIVCADVVTGTSRPSCAPPAHTSTRATRGRRPGSSAPPPPPRPTPPPPPPAKASAALARRALEPRRRRLRASTRRRCACPTELFTPSRRLRRAARPTQVSRSGPRAYRCPGTLLAARSTLAPPRRLCAAMI
jgi:hypothetical protein